MLKVNKDDITAKELKSLHPAMNLFKGVNFENVEYYRDDNGVLWEASICTDGTFDDRVNELQHLQKKNDLLKCLGIL